MNIHGEQYASIELVGIVAMIFLFVLNAIFVAPANRPCKLPLPLIALASIATAVAIILALGAGGFLLILLGCWALLISLLWLCIVLLDENLASSSSPRLYERVLLRIPYLVRIATALAYLGLCALIIFGGLKGKESIVVSILWCGAAAFSILGMFSVFACLGMVRNFWTVGSRTQRQIFTVANAIFFGAIGTLIWTKSVYLTQSGLPVLKPRLIEIGEPKDDRITFRDGELFGFIDPARRIVIPARFQSARAFSEGLAAVRQRNKWGYTDRTGQLTIPARFAAAAEFHDGLAACAVVGRRNGLQTTIVDEDLTPGAITTGSGTMKGPVWGVVNTAGKMIAGPSVFGDVSSFHYSPVHVQEQFAIKILKPENGSTASLAVTTNEPSHFCSVSIESTLNDSSIELQDFLNRLTLKCERNWYPRGLETPVELRVNGKYDSSSGRFDAGGFAFKSDFERSVQQLFEHPLLPYRRLNNTGLLELQFHFKHQFFPGRTPGR